MFSMSGIRNSLKRSVVSIAGRSSFIVRPRPPLNSLPDAVDFENGNLRVGKLALDAQRPAFSELRKRRENSDISSYSLSSSSSPTYSASTNKSPSASSTVSATTESSTIKKFNRKRQQSATAANNNLTEGLTVSFSASLADLISKVEAV